MRTSKLPLVLSTVFGLCLLVGLALADNKKIRWGNPADGPHAAFIDTNLFLTFGSGNSAGTASNPAVSSVVWTDMTATPCPVSNSTVATITSLTIPANALENAGDSITFSAAGMTALPGLVTTNRFVFKYGSTTNLESGLLIHSNSTYTADLTLTRVTATKLLSQATVRFNGGGISHAITNETKFITETNTVDTVLAFQGGSRLAGSFTNLLNRLVFEPTGK